MHVLNWIEYLARVVPVHGVEGVQRGIREGFLKPGGCASRPICGMQLQRLERWLACRRVEAWLLQACCVRGLRLEELEDGRLRWRGSDWVWNKELVEDVAGQVERLKAAHQKLLKGSVLRQAELYLHDSRYAAVAAEVWRVLEWLVDQPFMLEWSAFLEEVDPSKVEERELEESGLGLEPYCDRSHRDVLIRAGVELGSFLAKDQSLSRVRQYGLLGLLKYQYELEAGIQAKPRGPKKASPPGGAGWQLLYLY